MKIEKCLEEFYDYLEVEKNSSSETIRSYRNDFNGFISFLSSQSLDEDLDSIDVTDLKTYLVNWSQIVTGSRHLYLPDIG